VPPKGYAVQALVQAILGIHNNHSVIWPIVKNIRAISLDTRGPKLVKMSSPQWPKNNTLMYGYLSHCTALHPRVQDLASFLPRMLMRLHVLVS
jgi:hypothetical protein